MSTAPTLHLVIGGSLDGRWIPDDIRAPGAAMVANAVKIVGAEKWRVVQFRLGRAINRHVWILLGMSEVQAFDRLLVTYGGKTDG